MIRRLDSHASGNNRKKTLWVAPSSPAHVYNKTRLSEWLLYFPAWLHVCCRLVDQRRTPTMTSRQPVPSSPRTYIDSVSGPSPIWRPWRQSRWWRCRRCGRVLLSGGGWGRGWGRVAWSGERRGDPGPATQSSPQCARAWWPAGPTGGSGETPSPW